MDTTAHADLALTFPALQPSDFERLRDWLNTPHVYEWGGVDATPDGIGGPGGRAATVEAVAADYLPEMEQGGPTQYHLIAISGAPVGMVQSYPLLAYPDYATEIGETQPGTVGIDLLIGDASFVGRGIGASVIRGYVDSVVFAAPGVHRCVGAPERPQPAVHPSVREGRLPIRPRRHRDRRVRARARDGAGARPRGASAPKRTRSSSTNWTTQRTPKPPR